MLSEKTVFDKLEILEDGRILARRARIIMDDGVEISRMYHRNILEPGDDVTNAPARLRRIANAVWDETTITAWRNRPQPADDRAQRG